MYSLVSRSRIPSAVSIAPKLAVRVEALRVESLSISQVIATSILSPASIVQDVVQANVWLSPPDVESSTGPISVSTISPSSSSLTSLKSEKLAEALSSSIRPLPVPTTTTSMFLTSISLSVLKVILLRITSLPLIVTSVLESVS